MCETRRLWRRPGVLMLACMVMFACWGCERHPIASRYERQKGYEALDINDKDTAYEHFEEAVHRDPTDWKSHLELGRILLDRGDALQAQLHLEQALRMRLDFPERLNITDLLAEALYQQGRQEALYTLLRQASHEYGKIEDYLREGDYLSKVGDVDEALVAYQKAARFAKEDDARPYDRMANLYESVGDTGNAIRMLRYAYYLHPEDQTLWDRLRAQGVIPGPTVGLKPPRPQEEDGS